MAGVPSPAVFYLGIPLIALGAAATSRASDGYSLIVLIPCGLLIAYTGVVWIRSRAVWDRYSAWQRESSQAKLVAANLVRNQPQNDGWRMVSGGIAVVFGTAVCVLGVLGAAGVFA